MPHWEGIEDASAQADAVWLSRKWGETSAAAWKPLRKADCQELNRNSSGNNTKVYTEGGRSTADPAAGVIRYNFFRGHDRELCSAVWFVREEKGKEIILHPVTDVMDSMQMETLYQKAVEATSSLGKGIVSVIKEEVILQDGESKIQVVKAGDVLTLRKVPSGWFKNSFMLQRGYGEYNVPGEETELALGPVKHLIFVVHGIGEALFSREEIKVASLVEQTHAARMELQRKQLAAWKKVCEKAEKAGTAKPPPPARIEIIPIEWFNQMHDSSSALMRSLKATTLNSIPALRAIANDVVFDVLMYLTPAFCEAVLETVTEQINDLYKSFQVVHPNFLPSGGTCSLAGHSLGSVICWDLLAVLKQSNPDVSPLESTCGVSLAGGGNAAGYQAYAQAQDADTAQNGAYGPSLTKPMKRTLPFVPEHTLFLGSPLGIFLTLRGAHPVFDEMRKQAHRSEASSLEVPAVSPFTLPTKSLYNIFHPSDPVAYRIEPLLMSQDVSESDVPQPMYLTVPGQDVRLHVKLGEVVRKSFFDQKKGGGWGSLLESAVSAVGNQAETSATGKRKEGDGAITFPLGGKSGRVDFCLQPGVVESEYISAVTAHSSYFVNSDIQDFVIGLLAATEDEHRS